MIDVFSKQINPKLIKIIFLEKKGEMKEVYYGRGIFRDKIFSLTITDTAWASEINGIYFNGKEAIEKFLNKFFTLQLLNLDKNDYIKSIEINTLKTTIKTVFGSTMDGFY